MKINFKDKFESHILQRAYNYYKEGLVSNVHKEGDLICANIYGTEKYHVEVQIENEELVYTNCSCPYAATQEYCKHIAALLYYLNENDITSEIADTKPNDSLEELIEKIDLKELKKFIVELLESNEDIKTDFRMRFKNIMPVPPLAEYKRRVRNAINESGGRDGFIDYEESWEYEHKMLKITGELDSLIESGHYDLALELSMYILNTIPNTDIDDSNGSTGSIAGDCLNAISKILDLNWQDNKDIIDKIYNYICMEIKTSNLSNYGVELEDLIDKFIDNCTYVTETIELLEEVLNEKDKKSWHINWHIQKLIRLYEIVGDEKGIEKILTEHSDDERIFLQLVEVFERQGNIEKCIKLLKNRLQNKDDYWKKDIAKKLAQIEHDNNMNADYKQTLYDSLFVYDKGNLNVFKDIKKLYLIQEWKKERLNIIKKLESILPKYHLTEIYIEEELFDELYDAIYNQDMNAIIHYEKYLLPKYNDSLIDKYIYDVRKFAENNTGRKNYATLGHNLLHIKKMDNSTDRFNKLFEELKETQFRNKPAMKDEVSRILKVKL